MSATRPAGVLRPTVALLAAWLVLTPLVGGQDAGTTGPAADPATDQDAPAASLLDRPAEELLQARPEAYVLPDEAAIQAGLERGLAWLLENQEADGSWGSTRDPAHEFWSNPYTHEAWITGTTALVVMALLEQPDHADVLPALQRGVAYLVERPPLQRPSDWDVDNAWGEIYGLTALLAVERDGRLPRDPARTARIQHHLGALERIQSVDGGWGYYDFDTLAQRPSWSTSFMTAVAVLALVEAGELGLELPEGVLPKAVTALERCLLPSGAYTYSVDPVPGPGRLLGINQVQGSLSRIQVGNLALLRAGSERVGHQDLLDGLDLFFQHHRFLDVARKKPEPHEAYYYNSGYFYFFGHYYAARVLEQLTPAEQLRYRRRLAREVVKTLEEDGSMWDFYINTYGRPYGTAFGVMTLLRCQGREQPGG